MSQVEIVRLVLPRHEDKEKPVNELHPIQGVDPHVHEDTVQDRHGDELENRSELHREPSKQEDADTAHSLLPGLKSYSKVFEI